MTKLLGISVFALALMFSASTLSGCEKKDDKGDNKTKTDDPKKDGEKKPEGETKPDDTKKETAKTDGDKPAGDDKKPADDPTNTATADVKPDDKTPTATVAGDPGALIKKAADDVCACKDEACAKKVGERMQKWAMATMKTLKTPAAQKAFFTDLQTKYKGEMDRGKKCADKLKGPSKTTPTGPAGPIVTKFKKFTDQMCACKDAACSTKVQTAMMAWGKAQKQKPKPSDMAALMKVQRRFASCFMRLRKGGMKKMPK